MPHYKDFHIAAPFPENIPVADLARISLSDLRSGDGSASITLFKACREDGFCLLDLQHDTEGSKLLGYAGSLFDIGEKLFDLPYEEKMTHVMGGPRSVFG